jgi:hypothetical protein
MKKRLVLLLSDGKSQHASIRGAGTNTVYWWFKKHIIGKYCINQTHQMRPWCNWCKGAA